jgi:hypothetical protein
LNVLGVNCTTTRAFLVVADDGEPKPGGVEFIEATALDKSSEQLAPVLAECCRVIRELDPDRIVLLKPESGGRAKRTHAELVPRITLETLFRLAAVQADTPIEMVSRPTVRSRLGLPTKGPLAEHVPSCIPQKVGSNWCEERQLAALAALAGGAT